MITSIHQPAYLPWMGYFDKIARSDLFIFMDNVQFQKNSFQNRNRIRTKPGPIWLTVPVETSESLFNTTLAETRIDNRKNWRSKHAAALRMNYGRAANFNRFWPEIERFYAREWTLLSDLCWEMLRFFLQILAITTPLVRASTLPRTDNRKSDLVLSLCRTVSADAYISGAQGRDYLDLPSFREAGIAVFYQQYEHPTYAQLYPGFEPAMGIVDLLFCDPDPARHFRSARGTAGMSAAT